MNNTGRKPTFTARNCETIIDITLSLNCAAKGWRVTNEASHSDHSYIRYHLEGPDAVKQELVPNTAKANWEQFRKELKVNNENYVQPGYLTKNMAR